MGLVDIHARVEEAGRNALGSEARPDIRPASRSMNPSNKEVCTVWPYQADWKGLTLNKLSVGVDQNRADQENLSATPDEVESG